MSQSDSFINEVSDELRRDRLYHALRRYGWIAVLAVVLLVAAAAWNEWRKAQAEARAQAFGDAVIAALGLPGAEARRDALLAIPSEGPRAAVVAMLAAEAVGTRPADAPTADVSSVEALRAIAADEAVPPIYRDLATLKGVMAGQGAMTADAVADALAPISAPGAPFRLLAAEQIAIARAADGQTDVAVTALTAIRDDGEVTQDLQRRVSQLLVALGAAPDAT